MRLKKIELINIGPYKGVNIFNLDSKIGKNTILLGGKNGAGKTTLLSSVRLALYGSLAYGFRTISQTYINQVIELLNRDHLNEPSNNFQIRLDFTLSEELGEEDYSIIRSWSYNNETISEEVNVLKDDLHLSPVEEDNFFELLRAEFPPSLLELCFFDGEDILKLTSDNLLSSYLKELSYSLFNIDLLNDLEQELDSYSEQTSNTEREINLQETLQIEKNFINELSANLKEIKDKITEKKEKIKLFQAENETLNVRFKLHGGLVSEERESLQLKITNLYNERNQIADEIREFLAFQLPFYLSSDLMVKLTTQLEAEEDYHIANALRAKINNLPISDIIENLKIETDINQENRLIEELINHLAGNDKVNMIHNLSNTETQHIFNVFTDISQENIKDIINKVEQSRLHLKEIQSLRKVLRDNEDNTEFSEILSKLNEGNNTINQLENDITLLTIEKDEVSAQLEKAQVKYERFENELLRLQRKRASFTEAEKIMTVTRRFRKMQLRRKIRDIEYFSLLMIKKIMRKQNFIKKIQISPDTFDIRLYNHNQREINLTSLSAGETQLLVLCIIWGTVSAAKKQIPFIFDTMFGRLDTDHKEAIINKLIPEFGEQVIILATNSEITEALYPDLKQYVSNEYTLVYDDHEEKTNIHPGFFNSGKEVITT